MSEVKQMTRAEFARRATGIASTCSSWAVSVLVLPEKAGEPIHESSVARFLAEVREWCDSMEEWSRAALTQHERSQTEGM